MANPPTYEIGRQRRRQIMEIISRPDGPHDLKGIAAECGVCVESIYHHIQALRRMGYLAPVPFRARSAIYPAVKFGTGAIHEV